MSLLPRFLRRFARRPADEKAVASIENFLLRLDRVRKVAPDRWVARCPAHEDDSPSLSIRLVDDGRILVHDFGLQCEVGDICAALGLSVMELRGDWSRPYMRPEERGTNTTGARASDFLTRLDDEARVVRLIALRLTGTGEPLRENERQRLNKAVRFIGDLRATIRPAKRPREKPPPTT